MLSLSLSLGLASLGLTSAAAVCPPASQAPIEEVPIIEVFAWADPVAGNDLTGQINDPTQPFKTLQKSIDKCFDALVALNIQPGSPYQAIVYAQPGVYGPAGVGPNPPHASGDLLPIVMRDRVHVRGVNARSCVLRGLGNPLLGGPNVFFPNRPQVGGVWVENGAPTQAEILLDLSFVNFGYPGSSGGGSPPWYDMAHHEWDTLEVFEGFTFQSGDIQVYSATGSLYVAPGRAVVANCVFDMRNGWYEPVTTVTVPGPTFGVMLNKLFVGGAGSGSDGYVDQPLLLLGNTFVFGRFQGGEWMEASLDDAVGVIDVTDSGCATAAGPTDCDINIRGVGNCALVNNLFRTHPFTPGPTGARPMAMIGIDVDDTELLAGTPTVRIATNAFAPSRVGSSNGGTPAPTPTSAMRPVGLFSAVVDAVVASPANPPAYGRWDCGAGSATGNGCPPTVPCPGHIAHPCSASLPPVPAVIIYDGPGTPGIDPGFVGEFLGTLPSPNAILNNLDWRLLPGSPLKDAGFVPAPGDPLVMANGLVFDFASVIPEANPFTFDGEGYGNPRVVGNSVDLGFDELHLFTMAGSYSNYSSSHHTPGALNPDLAPAGLRRWVILPTIAGTQPIQIGMHVRIHGKMQNSPQPAGTTPTGWYQPPATLYRPVIDTNLPVHYQTRYIAFNNTAPSGFTLPTPWTHTLANPDIQSYQGGPIPGSQAPFSFWGFAIDDNECSGTLCELWYFNSEAVVRLTDTSPDLMWSNLQAEYR